MRKAQRTAVTEEKCSSVPTTAVVTTTHSPPCGRVVASRRSSSLLADWAFSWQTLDNRGKLGPDRLLGLCRSVVVCAHSSPLDSHPVRLDHHSRQRRTFSVSSDERGKSTLVGFKSVRCVPRVSVLAAVLAFAALPAHADGFSALSAVDGPAVSLLSGVQLCEPTFLDDLSEGSQCMAGWAVNHLLFDAVTGFATTQGQALFGEHFRIVSSMGFSPSEGTLSGGLDVVLPLAASTLSGAAPSETGAFFLQQGVTRWVDVHGLD